MAILLIAIAAITLAVLRYHSRRSLATSSTSAGSAAGSSPSSSDPVPTPLANSDGSVENQVLPNPSQSAKNTIHGRIKVRVKVAVDPAGQVADAKFTLPGPSKYFARLAMEAAERWQFSAPTQNGQPVASEWNLVFEFARGGTSAQAQRITPSSAMN